MMKSLQELILIYDEAACRDLEKLEALRDVLKSTSRTLCAHSPMLGSLLSWFADSALLARGLTS